MSAKSKLSHFRISKRYEIWVETTVSARDLEHALEQSKNLQLGDFMSPDGGAELLDSTQLKGTSISEEW